MDMLLEKRMTIVGYDSWIDANDRYSMNLYKKNLSDSTFVGAYCMTLSTNQTFHHWKIFADGNSGVCIIFDEAKFDIFLNSLDCKKYMHDSMKYIPYKAKRSEQDSSMSEKFGKIELKNLPFIKRASFESEYEFRIVCTIPDNDEKIHHIDFDPDIIQQIVLSPFVTDGLIKSIKASLKKIDGCPRRISKARMTDSTTWQKALSRYASKALETVNA